MPFTIYTDNADFDTKHENMAMAQLSAALDARFGKGVNPYALLVNIVIEGARIDLVALTARAIIVIDLKNVGSPGTVIDGVENGPWYAFPPNMMPFELNKGRRNPFKQLDSYRFKLINWFDKNSHQIFSTQRAEQLSFRHIGARVVFTPTINAAATRQKMPFLTSEIGKWFDVIGLDMLADNLRDAETPGITLSQEDMDKIASAFRLHSHKKRPAPAYEPPTIPERLVFSQPPVPRASVDRETELMQLLEAVENQDTTLVIIGGPGGVGKTHLAGRLAQELAKERKVYWIYCKDRPDLTLETLILGFARELPDLSLAYVVARSSERLAARLDIILDFLDDNRACLFFDDYHLLDQSSGLHKLFQHVDRTGRYANIILTSRQRPGFWRDAFEAIDSAWELRPEGLPRDRITEYLSTRPGLSSLELSNAEIEEIWIKTGGGNPTALRLLAQQSIGTSPVDWVRSMNVYDDTSAQRWYSSLFERLSKPAYQMARKLSVLRGVFPETLAATLHTVDDFNIVLTELLDHYVLERANLPRSCVMIGLLQDYLYSQIKPDQQATFHRQAARHLFTLAQNPPSGYSSLDLQTEGLYHSYVAQDWKLLLRNSRSVVAQLGKTGEWQRGRQIAERALHAAEMVKDQLEEAYWLLELTHQLRRLDDLSQAATYCKRGYDLAEALGITDLRANAHYQLGILEQHAGNLSEARRWQESALDLNRKLGDKTHIADSLGRLGSIARSEGDNATALVNYQESARLYEEIGDVRGLGVAYIQLGTLAKYEEDFEQANSYFQRSLTSATQISNLIGQAIVLQSLAEVASRQGDFMHSLSLIDQALAKCKAAKSRYSYRITLGIKVDIFLDAGQAEEAERILQEVESLHTEPEEFIGHIANRRRRGRLALLRGEKASGIALLQDAAQQFKAKNFMQYAKDCDRFIAIALSV